MSIVKKCFWWKLVIFSVLLLISCGKESDQETVARAGKRKIGWTELYQSFNLEPKWGRGLTQKDAYYNQLDYLIDEKVFAQEAETGQPQLNDDDFAGYLQFLEEKELIRELYRQEVSSKIIISDDEYQNAYRFSKIQLRYAYIETSDSARASDYAKQLASAGDFSTIGLFLPGEDQKGESPWVKYGDVDEELEKVLFNLELGETAGPVYIAGKYYVVKLLEGNREKFQSAMDFAESKSKIRKIIFDRRSAKISEAYVRKIMSGKNVRLNPSVFAVALNHFTRLAVRSVQDNYPSQVQLRNSELREMERNLKDILAEPIVFFADGQMTIAEFLTKLLNMPVGLRPQIHMAQDLKVAIGRVVRNHYFVREARSRGLDKIDAVRDRIQREQDKAWAHVWLKKLQGKIVVSDEEVRQFIKSEYYTNLQKRLGYEPDTTYVRDIICDLKFKELRSQAADSLRSKYGIEINKDKLITKIKNPDGIIKDDPIAFTYQEEFY
jgi:hypothetical protein